jgi:hypothetical protein
MRTTSTTSTTTTTTTIVIPMEGLAKQQWLAVAPFWHPIHPAAVVDTWDEAELLLIHSFIHSFIH